MQPVPSRSTGFGYPVREWSAQSATASLLPDYAPAQLSAGQTPGSGHRCSCPAQRRSARAACGGHRTWYKTRRPRRQPGHSRHRRCSSCGDRNDVCFVRIGHTANRTRALPTVVEDAGPRLLGLPSGRRLLRRSRVEVAEPPFDPLAHRHVESRLAVRLVSRTRIDRSSHGTAPSSSNIAMLSAMRASASSRSRPASHSPCSSRLTATQNRASMRRNPAIASVNRSSAVAVGGCGRQPRSQARHLRVQERPVLDRFETVDRGKQVGSVVNVAGVEGCFDCLDEALRAVVDLRLAARQLECLSTGRDGLAWRPLARLTIASATR